MGSRVLGSRVMGSGVPGSGVPGSGVMGSRVLGHPPGYLLFWGVYSLVYGRLPSQKHLLEMETLRLRVPSSLQGPLLVGAWELGCDALRGGPRPVSDAATAVLPGRLWVPAARFRASRLSSHIRPRAGLGPRLPQRLTALPSKGSVRVRPPAAGPAVPHPFPFSFLGLGPGNLRCHCMAREAGHDSCPPAHSTHGSRGPLSAALTSALPCAGAPPPSAGAPH